MNIHRKEVQPKQYRTNRSKVQSTVQSTHSKHRYSYKPHDVDHISCRVWCKHSYRCTSTNQGLISPIGFLGTPLLHTRLDIVFIAAHIAIAPVWAQRIPISLWEFRRRLKLKALHFSAWYLILLAIAHRVYRASATAWGYKTNSAIIWSTAHLCY